MSVPTYVPTYCRVSQMGRRRVVNVGHHNQSISVEACVAL
jgi:hypothetical protein